MRANVCFVVLSIAVGASGSEQAVQAFLQKHCMACHDADARKGGLDLQALSKKLDQRETFGTWVKIHDRLRDGEMPPPKRTQPEAAERSALMSLLEKDLTSADLARQKTEGRAQLRRLNRVEFENTLRDLLEHPGLRLKESLPPDGTAHGFDRLSSALDTSFVHMESYLAAVDAALNEALCPLVEKPPVFKYRYSPWHLNRHQGKECEGSIGLAVREKIGILLNGMKRDDTYISESAHKIVDNEPLANAVGLFRHEDADFRVSMTAMHPVLSGLHKLRISGYSFGWDGTQVVPTERHGALGLGIFSKGEHYGTVDLPPNKPAEREISAWLERGGGMTHGTDDNIRVIPASCENFRDYAHGKNKDVLGPMSPAPGVALEWIELEGPIHEQWPPASHKTLFGDLAVKEWTKTSVVPKPVQQVWPRGHVGGYPKDIYGERGEKRQAVYVESLEPQKDAERLLKPFLRRAFRRPLVQAELATYTEIVKGKLNEGAPFQDAMIAAYRMALASPNFLLLEEPTGTLNDHALAQRLSYFLWSSMPDAELFAAADRGELLKPAVLRAQTERMLQNPKGKRFVENFTGQWLHLRDINSTQPDSKLYPEFMPYLQEAMILETHAYFSELLKNDLGVTHLVRSDFAMLNEPLARHYGIEGVKGWEMRRVALAPDNVRRGGFLTQGSVLKITANGTTTSPVKRGAFVMEKIMGIVPTPPPPEAGSIEPDVRGATTVRQQLEKHRSNATCAGCHQKMDGYGFALESFDVAGEWRDRYRAVGGKGADRKKVNGRHIEYHFELPVDCTGTMPDGRAFKNVAELRDLLAASPQTLARAFTAQLLTYAAGAEVSFSDRAGIDAILKKSQASHYGLRTLIHEVIQSELFRTK